MTKEDFLERYGRCNSIEATMRLYIDAGMLKLDEPKSADDKLREIIVRHTSSNQAQCILNAIARAAIGAVQK